MKPIPEQSLAAAVISFGRFLKEHGISVSTPAVMDALVGVSSVGVEDFQDFRTVLRTNFLTRVEELALFERLFSEFWAASDALAAELPARGAQSPMSGLAGESLAAGDDLVIAEAGVADSQERQGWDARPYVIYSPLEVLREQNFEDLPESEDHRMSRIIREILAPLFRRRSARKRPASSGTSLDFRKLLRRNIRYGGDIYELPRLAIKRRIKRLVFLCDVSGSMNPYLRVMLRFIKELQEIPTTVETFVFATRLHRITPLLTRLPFQRAMREVAHAVRDWSGGTRIGPCLREFTSYRGGGMLRSSTVVVIHSDGWDRGDAEILQSEMMKIHRRAYRVLWINPLLGGPAYEPTCRGMKTALPYVDLFLPGHNLLALERVAGTLAGIV